MAKNEFEIKKIKDDNITIEEQIEKKASWVLLFWRKYGSIFSIILIFLAITAFTVGIGLAVSNFMDNANKIHDIKIKTTVEYINGNDLEILNTYPVTENQADLLYEKGEAKAAKFVISNNSDVKIRCKIEIIDQNPLALNKLNTNFINYKIKENDKLLDSKKLIMEKGIGNLHTTVLDPLTKTSFELRMWIDENVGNDAQNKEFKGSLAVYYELVD